MRKNLSLSLVDGTSNGPKIAEIRNWAGIGLYAPVERAAAFLERKEFERPGIYILKSEPKEESFNERVYIGESDLLRNRLKQHLAKVDKRPFDAFVAFTGASSLLNKTAVMYLEHKLIQTAHENKSSEVVNKVQPSLPSISENDRSDMDYFYKEMRLLLPLIGFEFTNPRILTSLTASNEGKSTTSESVPVPVIRDLYRVKHSSLEAYMYVQDGDFIVTKGSQVAKKESNTIGDKYVRLRRNLLVQNLLLDKGEYFELLEDTVFTSTSAASNVVLGRQSPGPRVWVHTEKGKTYGQLLAEELTP